MRRKLLVSALSSVAQSAPRAFTPRSSPAPPPRLGPALPAGEPPGTHLLLDVGDWGLGSGHHGLRPPGQPVGSAWRRVPMSLGPLPPLAKTVTFFFQ